MKRLSSLAAFVLFSIVPLFGQGTNPPEQAESHVGQLVSEGARLFTAGNINAALEQFRQAHSLAPDDVEAIIGLARAESQHMDNSGKADMQTQALADYQTALAKQPTAELYTELGIFFDSRLDYAAAIKAYRKALDLDPQLFGAELNYGNALVSVGDFDNAISVYSKACAQNGSVHPGTATGCGSIEIATNRGQAYLKKGDCSSLALAEKDFSEGVSHEPENARLHDWLGTVFMAEGMENLSNCAHSKQERTAYLERAWSELRIALNLDSSNVMTRGAFVALSEVLKRKPEYNGGIAKEPDKAEVSQLLADRAVVSSTKSLDSLGSLESLTEKGLDTERNQALAADQDSVAAAKEAIRAEPTDGFAWSKLSDAYFQLGDYKNAKEATEKAIEIFTERFKNAKPPSIDDMLRGYDEQSTNVSMLASSYGQMATICYKLHKKREARRNEDAALRAFDVLRMMQPSSSPAEIKTEQQRRNGASRPAQPPPSSPPSRAALTPVLPPQCQLPMHELCQYPTFRPQPYDPNKPYTAPDTRDYDRCVLGNQREDARYQQCVQQQQREQQRERQNQ